MKKIKYKIAIPYMAIIVAIPLVTMVIFNIIMQAYILKTSKADLKDAIETTNYLFKQQEGSLLKQNQENIETVLPKLKYALKTSKLATKTEIIILNKQGKLIYPKTIAEDSFLNNDMIYKVSTLGFDKSKTTQQIKVDNKKYLLARQSSKLPFKIIYILSMDNANGLIRTINIILISILAL